MSFFVVVSQGQRQSKIPIKTWQSQAGGRLYNVVVKMGFSKPRAGEVDIIGRVLRRTHLVSMRDDYTNTIRKLFIRMFIVYCIHIIIIVQ